MNTVFLIKPYNPYIRPAEGETIRFIFTLHDRQFAICEATLDWGRAQVAVPIDEEDDFGYRLYDTYEEAYDYVQLLKRLAK